MSQQLVTPLPQYQFSRRYAVVEPIGHGGMGVVYRVYDRLTNQHVALKSLSLQTQRTAVQTGIPITDLAPAAPDLQFTSHMPVTDIPESSKANTNTLRLALAQEFRMLSALRHPHIIAVLDYGFDFAQQPYLVMELVQEAVPISDYGAGRDLADQVQLLVQTLQALSYLHRRGVIHRDVKPGNILVNDQSQVKVVDFGLSFTREQPLQADQTIAGTLAYIAPETLTFGIADRYSDLYSFGIIAYELLTGKHPFGGNNNHLLEAIFHRKPDLTPLPENLRPIISRLLEKLPHDRYSTADEVIKAICAATHLPLPIESMTVRENQLQAARFVGREDELNTLKAQLQQAKTGEGDGEGSLWLVGGESGVGKSRLVEELRVMALVEGFTVVRGQTVENGRILYQLLRNPLRELAMRSDITDRQASVIKPLVPDIDSLIGKSVETASNLDGRAAQQRLASTLVSLLRQQQRPILLLLEDLQWAEESLDVVRELGRWLHGMRVMVVATYRDDERPDLPDRLPGARLLSLKRLSIESVAQLTAAILGDTAPAAQLDLVDTLMRETEGNVFFMVEVMRLLAEDAGSISRIGIKTIPSTLFAGGIRAVVERRLSRVPEFAQNLLLYAAVAGREIDLAVLRHLAPEIDLEQWLTVCANAFVIERQDNIWRFSHDKLREFQISRIDEADRPGVYSKVARAVEAIHRDHPDYTEQLIHLWETVGDLSQETHHRQLAAENAYKTGLYSKALAHFERLLLLHHQTRITLETAAVVRLYLRIGDVCYAMGDYAQAKEHLLRCVEISKQAVHTAADIARARNLLGNIALALGDTSEAQQQLQASLALSTAEDNQLEMGKTLRSLGVVTETLGDYVEAERLFTSALSYLSAPDINDHLGIAATQANLASIARRSGDFVRAKQRYQDALVQFESIEFQWGMAFTMTSLGVMLVESGNKDDYLEARNLHSQAFTICQNIGHKWGAAYSENNLAVACLADGDLADAHYHLHGALQTALEIKTQPLILDIFAVYADWLAAQSQSSQTQAGAVLALVINHPLTEPETSEKARASLAKLSDAERNPSPVSYEQVLEAILSAALS